LNLIWFLICFREEEPLACHHSIEITEFHETRVKGNGKGLSAGKIGNLKYSG
jgi:hypothetical protein